MGILIVWGFQIIEGDAEAEGQVLEQLMEVAVVESPHCLVIKAFSAKHLILTTLIQMLPDVIALKKLLNTLSLSNACIGTTKSGEYQNVLSKARKELSLKQAVSVRLMPEPNNPIDKSAIALQCYMNGNWMRIGYI